MCFLELSFQKLKIVREQLYFSLLYIFTTYIFYVQPLELLSVVSSRAQDSNTNSTFSSTGRRCREGGNWGRRGNCERNFWWESLALGCQCHLGKKEQQGGNPLCPWAIVSLGLFFPIIPVFSLSQRMLRLAIPGLKTILPKGFSCKNES